MSKKVAFKILKEEKELVYKISSILGEENYSEIFENIIKNVYKNAWRVKVTTDEHDWIENISIYSVIEFSDISKIKDILTDIGIELNNESEIHIVLKNNIEKIEKYRDVSIPDDLDENIEKCFNKIKNQILKISSIVVGMLSIIIIVGSFILVPHYAYQLTPFGNMFNSIHCNIFDVKPISPNNYELLEEVTPPDRKIATIDLIHHMSNSLIIASDNNAKIGIVEVTPKNIEIAINAVREHMQDDKLIERLDKWRNGNFYNATVVHNYVWHMLNGEIGYAVGIDEGKVDYILNQIYK